MSESSTIVVAVEDMPTAAIVAVEGARVALEHNATTIVLLHVIDQHYLMSAVLGVSGQCASLAETPEEVEAVFTVAEGALRAEFRALGRPEPTIEREIDEGNIPLAIEHAASAHHADLVVLGARRPHAFGRLVHPDVRSHVASHAPCKIHVASLQETPQPAHS